MQWKEWSFSPLLWGQAKSKSFSLRPCLKAVSQFPPFLLSEGQTLWSLPVSFSVLFISLWGRFYYGQLSPECWQVQCCRQAGTQINSTKTQPATGGLRGCSKRHDLVPSLSETRIISSLLGRARDRQNFAFSSLVLLFLMFFRNCGVGGVFCLVWFSLQAQHCEIPTVWICSAQLWALYFIIFFSGSSNSLRLLRDCSAVLCTWGKAPWTQSCMPKERESKPGSIWWAQCWLSAWLLLILSSCFWAYIWGYIRSQSAFAQSLSVLLEGKSNSFNLECNQTWAY